MIDTDFERNPTAALLTNDGYFARHRELAAEHGVKEAWEIVEAELPFNIRRYRSYGSFENAKKKYIEGAMPATAQFTRKC